MANYDSLINAIKAAVKTNGTGAITGATLQATLLGTIEELTVGFQFMGVATPDTTPDSNDKKEFYLGFAGTYANFGSSVTVPEGSVILFKKNNGVWSSQVVKIVDPVSVSQNTSSGGLNLSVGSNTYNIAEQKILSAISKHSPYNIFTGGFEYGNLDDNGEPSGTSQNYIRTQEFTEIPLGTSYVNLYVNSDLNIAQTYFLEYDSDKVLISGRRRRIEGGTSPWNNNIDIAQETKYVKFFFFNSQEFQSFENIIAQISIGYGFTKYYPQYEAIDQFARKTAEDLDGILSTCIKEFPTSQISDASILSTLDDCDINTIYRINCPSETPLNCPFNQGIVFTVGWNKDEVDTLAQFAKGLSDNILWVRMKWGQSWTQWQRFDNGIAKDKQVDFGFIESFAVIGDSYASGEIYVDDISDPRGYTSGDYYNKSWGQVLARKYGASCINMSAGGLTTKTWLTSQKGLVLLNSSEAQELYLCALGHNDMAEGLSYLGTPADIETKADTFYGNYATIIESIQSKAPNGKIVLMTCAYLYNSVEDSFNEAIKNIADAYSVPYIDIKKDAYYSSDSIYHTGQSWNHPTAPLYAGMARANARLFIDCVSHYYNYFKDLI